MEMIDLLNARWVREPLWRQSTWWREKAMINGYVFYVYRETLNDGRPVFDVEVHIVNTRYGLVANVATRAEARQFAVNFDVEAFKREMRA